MKLIWISTDSITNKIFHNFGLEYMENKGYLVEIWCLCRLWRDDGGSSGCYDSEGLHLFQSYRSLENAVRRERCQSFLIREENCISNSIYIKLLEKYQCHYIVFGQNATLCYQDFRYTPNDRYLRDENRGNSLTTIRRWIKKGPLGLAKTIGEIIDEKYYANKTRSVGLPQPKVVLWCNERREKLYSRYSCFLRMPSVDQSIYNEIKVLAQEEVLKKNEIIHKEYILFVSSGYGFRMRGLLPLDYKNFMYNQSDRKAYFEKLEHLMSILENHYKMPVFIAAHPNIDYEGYDFGGRRMFYEKTAELTKYCNFCVFNYNSVAVSFPILYKKDIMLVYTDQTTKDYVWNEYYLPLIEGLQLEACNMDNEEMMKSPWRCRTHIAESLREKYMIDNITFGYETEETIGEVLERALKPHT